MWVQYLREFINYCVGCYVNASIELTCRVTCVNNLPGEWLNFSHSTLQYTSGMCVSIYTERPKKLITSSERCSLKSTASKLIIFRHRKAVVLLMKHIWKIKRLLLPKKRKMWWNRKRSLFRNHRKCSLRTSTKGHLFRTFNSYSYSFNLKGGLCNRRTGYCPYRAPCPGGEQFLWSLKNDLLRFHLYNMLFFFYSSKHNFFDVLGKEYYS